VFAAFGEEFLYRGYLLTRLAEIFGGGRVAWGLAIIGQAIAFALAHWYQGPVGMFSIGVGAVIAGIAASAWGRNLWPAIVAHGLMDTIGFTMLYLGQPIS
jgi:membrane protease YdiL (CAAX protease family)